MKACVHRDEGWDYLGCTPSICTEKQHFRGFTATWQKSGGATETHEFGDCSTYYTWDGEITIPDEIVYFTMNVDDNDIEGLAFRDYT